MIRLALCDDNGEYCRAWREYFAYCEDMDFVGITHSATSCLRMIHKEAPDVLLLDGGLEEKESTRPLIARLLEAKSDLKIIVLSDQENEDHIFRCFADGVANYLSKSLPFEQVLEAVENAYHGKQRLHHNVTKILVNKTRRVSEGQKSVLYLVNKLLQLSPTEFDVLKMLYYGSQYKDIAKVKVVEESTVRTQGSRILKKFEYNSMKELLAYLREIGIFDLVGNNTRGKA